jgi:hemerythrin-like domain-containing protein
MSSTSQLAILRHEHDVAIGLMTSILDQAQAFASSSSGSQSPADMRRAMQELGDAMLLHFRVEEEGLYPRARQIAAEGAPRVDILTSFFNEESDDDLKAHALLRARLKELGAMLDRARTDGLSAELAARLASAAHATHDLLSRHASKETTLIFPLIERFLDTAQMAAVEERMRSIRQSAPNLTC